MEMQHGVSLKQYSAMRLGGLAAHLAVVNTQAQLVEAATYAKANNLPIIVVGDGSNIIWRDEGFPGLVIINRVKGFEVTSDDEFGTYITIGAGENWDSVVARTVEMGLSGIECLSLVPGTAGATPVQNVGAYGQEIAQTLITVTAYDLNANCLVTLAAADCEFTYRSSVFKHAAKGRYLITSITLMLNRNKPLPPFYPSLSNYLEQHEINDFTPAILRQAVLDIRRSKLPDPTTTPNCGSFFANPIVDSLQFNDLRENYPEIPNWPADNDQVKLSAAWLIDQVGYHDYTDPASGMATWPSQSLVLVNRSASSTSALLQFVEQIKSKVAQQFMVQLEMEPQLLPENLTT